MCPCETKCQEGYRTILGSANLPQREKVSRDMGYRSDSFAVSRDTGPLSSLGVCESVVSKRVVLADVPLYRNIIQKGFPCSATVARESHDFGYSWTPQTWNKGTSAN